MRPFLLLLHILAFCAAAQAADLTVIQTTDIHGNLSLENIMRPGFIRIASGIREIRNKAGAENTLLIDCGDLTQGTASAARDRGQAMIRALNEMRYDVWVPGNHDFDWGTESLLDRMAEFNGSILAANLRFIPPFEPPARFRKWALFRRAGRNIAVIGCVPPYLDQWIATPQLNGVEVSDPVEAIREIMPEIEKANPHLLILAIHLGEFSSGRLASDGKRQSISAVTSAFPRIRAVLGGHTHCAVPPKRIFPASVYIQAPPLGDGFAFLTFRFDESYRDNSVTGGLRFAAELPADPVLEESFRDFLHDSALQDKTPVAKVPFPLEPSKGAKTRSVLSELFCSAMIAASGADAAFSTTFGKFITQPGVLREREIFLLVPYENYISILTLNGVQLREIIEEQYALKQKNVFLHSAGLQIKVNSEGKVTELVFRGRSILDDPAAQVRTAFTSYAVCGAGGRYPCLRRIADEVPRRDSDLMMRDVFRSYLKAHYPLKK